MRTLTSLSTLRVWAVVCVCCALAAVWPSGAALAAATPEQTAHVDSPRAMSPHQSNSDVSQASAAKPTDAEVALDLVRLDPQSVKPGSTVTAEVAVTNSSATPLDNAVLDLSIKPSRVTDRTDLADWSRRSGDADLNDRGRTVSASAPVTIAPGATSSLKVSIPADSLNLGNDASLWGPRRIALTIRTGTTPASAGSRPAIAQGGTRRSALHTFIVWQPSATPPPVDVAYLAPVAASDPAIVATNPEAYAREAATGELSDRVAIASHSGATMWLDPSLRLPVALPTSEAKSEPAAEHTAADSPETAEDAKAPVATAAPVTEAKKTSAWKPHTAQQALNARIAKASKDRKALASPFAGADPAALASLPEPARAAIKADAVESGNAPIVSRVQGDRVSVDSVKNAAQGTNAVLVPAESLTPQVRPAVTPSGYAQVVSNDSTTPVLGYDTQLTHIAETMRAGDPEEQVARALAETSLVAGQNTDASRVLLIAPSTTADLDPRATGRMLDAFNGADWVKPVNANDLLTQAQQGTGTQKLHGGQGYFWPGKVTSLHAISVGADGTPTHTNAAPPSSLPVRDQAGQQISRIATVRNALQDPQYANGAYLLSVSTLNSQLADANKTSQRLAAAEPVVTAHEKKIRLSMSNNYNLVSAGAGVPFTVRNDFDTPITVTPRARVSERIVRVKTPDQPMTVAARSSAHSKINIEALTSGTLSISVSLTHSDGSALQSRTSSLSVNPDWENWSTFTLAAAMVLLVIVGVIRAGRTRSDARAPAEFGPEDLHSVDAPQTSPHSEESDTAS